MTAPVRTPVRTWKSARVLAAPSSTDLPPAAQTEANRSTAELVAAWPYPDDRRLDRLGLREVEDRGAVASLVPPIAPVDVFLTR